MFVNEKKLRKSEVTTNLLRGVIETFAFAISACLTMIDHEYEFDLV